MIYALLLLILFIILPLAINRGEAKRVLLLAFGFEVLKYLFRFTIAYSLAGLDCGGVCYLLAGFVFIIMFPEFIISHAHEPVSLWREGVMFTAGIVWNMVPAFIIFLCLPQKSVAGDLNKPLPTSSI